MMLIFEHSSKGRNGAPQSPVEKASVAAIPENLLRKNSAALPEVSELQAVRHYTRLSQKNFFLLPLIPRIHLHLEVQR